MDDLYKATMNLWLKHHLPCDAEKLQKTYLRNHIRKPVKLSIKVANSRLTGAINAMLKYMIAPDNSIPLILTDDKLSDIVYRSVKNLWRVKMRDMGKRVTSYTNHNDSSISNSWKLTILLLRMRTQRRQAARQVKKRPLPARNLLVETNDKIRVAIMAVTMAQKGLSLKPSSVSCVTSTEENPTLKILMFARNTSPMGLA
jgi:hypothetical protein